MIMENDLNNNKHDLFSEKVKSKLENHRLPVDAELWNDIEKGLALKKRRKVPAWLWIPLGSAAVIALLFTFHSPSELKTIADKIEIKSSNLNQPDNSKTIVKEKDNLQIKPKKSNSKNLSIEHLHFTQQAENQLADVKLMNLQADSKSSDSIKNSEVTMETTEDFVSDVATSEISVVRIDSSRSQKRIQNLASNFPDQPLKNKFNKPGTIHNWELAASLTSGNGFQTNCNSNYLVSALNDTKTIVSATTTYTSVLTPSNFSKISFSVPVSFGLIGRINLDKTISLESGMAYTFLQTNYNNIAENSPDAQLNLHYVGIPLNLIVKLWSNPQWEVYISGGGMLEKGIRSVYVQHTYSGNQIFTTTINSSIDGFQSSINGAIGTTYKFKKNLGIFFEPKMSYFFNNNQPASVRTDQPTTIGLTAGLRYEFNSEVK